MMRTLEIRTVCLALLGLLAACGSEDVGRAKKAPPGDVVKPLAAAESEATAANHPPVIRRVDLQPQRPTAGNTISASVDAFDPDGDEIALSYAWSVDGASVGGDEAALLLGNVSKGSTIRLTVVARDLGARSPAETATTRVGNRPPTMLGVVIDPLGEVRANHDISATPRAEDPDGDRLEFRYRWRVNRRSVAGDGAVLPASHYGRGDQIQLTVEAWDGEASSEPLSSDPFGVVNAPPRITSTPGGFDPDGTFRYAILAEDPDGDRSFRYRLANGPSGMTIDEVSGELTWKPVPEQAGANPVTIEVSDRKGGVTRQSFDVHVVFEEATVPAAPAK
jgi:hypothetical protein